MSSKTVIIIGAGPAGLTAACELRRHAVPCIILEADGMVGGLARTVHYKGFLFDIGGHRFFSKWDEVNELWREVLGQAFVRRRRLSRIYYRGRFFAYPLKPLDALSGLGGRESLRVMISYLRAQIFRSRSENNLEEWVSNRFGKRLYEIFFKSYTEKVWGKPAATIGADWAAQRINSLTLGAAIRHAFFKPRNNRVKSLVEHFHYPEKGPGQMWTTLANQLSEQGCEVRLNSPVSRICHEGGKLTGVTIRRNGETETLVGTDCISSMPMRDLVAALDPQPPPEVQEAAKSLAYRDFIIVSLIINRKDLMPDNWIYIHDPEVKVGRIQNFKNWSPMMVPDQTKTCLGMEYFVSVNDETWKKSDLQLIELAKSELAYLGLASRSEIIDGTVVRVRDAYPVYDHCWIRKVAIIRRYLEEYVPNLQLVGRNGMHKYNNQDHSMITALYAARNILGGTYDLWQVNTQPDYHEHNDR